MPVLPRSLEEIEWDRLTKKRQRVHELMCHMLSGAAVAPHLSIVAEHIIEVAKEIDKLIQEIE